MNPQRPLPWPGIALALAAGVGMREDERRITHNNSRFVPHYFR